MFRRKDETADLLTEEGTGATMTQTGQTSSSSTTDTKSESTSSAGTAPTSSSAATMYTPARPAEAAKPASMPGSSAASMYRPSAPGADMNRGRTSQDFRGAATTAGADKSNTTGKTNRRILTVGNDILLKGEIATCDRLVIEGKVDATLKDVHTVEIAENGSFKGNAEIEDAEISGLFEGDLVVRNRLVIYSSGKVRGKITYGEIEIERGGELTGEIKTVNAAGNKSAGSGSSGKFGDSNKANAA